MRKEFLSQIFENNSNIFVEIRNYTFENENSEDDKNLRNQCRNASQTILDISTIWELTKIIASKFGQSPIKFNTLEIQLKLKKIKKNQFDFYEIQRTRIHLQIEQIFQSNQTFFSKQKGQKKDSEKQKDVADNSHSTSTKGKTPNFVIEGNTLVFMNTSSQKNKGNTSYDSESSGRKQGPLMSKANHLVSQERPISKVQNNKNSINQNSATEQTNSVDLSKMSIAQKVLYYKKQKQLVSEDSLPQKQIIVKDSSVSSTSHNYESKSSNNDSGIHIKTEKINKHKIMIITSQQVEVQGNSDDDLQKMAREKIAHIQKKKLQRSRDLYRQKNNSTKNGHKGDNSLNSGHDQKYLKGLDENSLSQKPSQKPQDNQKQINSKILQAKLKAKSILEKYGQKLKK